MRNQIPIIDPITHIHREMRLSYSFNLISNLLLSKFGKIRYHKPNKWTHQVMARDLCYRSDFDIPWPMFEPLQTLKFPLEKQEISEIKQIYDKQDILCQFLSWEELYFTFTGSYRNFFREIDLLERDIYSLKRIFKDPNNEVVQLKIMEIQELIRLKRYQAKLLIPFIKRYKKSFIFFRNLNSLFPSK